TIGKDVLQFGEAPPQQSEQRYCAVNILDIGCVDQECEQQALRIGNDVALAPFDALEHVKTTRAAAFCGLRALGVTDAAGVNGSAPDPYSGALDEREIDLMPEPLVAPGIEIVLNSRPRRKIPRQQSPLATAGQHVEDSVDHGSQLDFTRAPDTARWRQKKRKQ